MDAVLARSHHHYHCGSSISSRGRECGFGIVEAVLAPRLFSPSCTTSDSRRSSLFLVTRAGKGERPVGTGIPQRQPIPSFSKLEDDGNPKFVIFFRDKQVPLWLPLNILTGGSLTKMVVGVMGNIWRRSMAEGRVSCDLGKTIYKQGTTISCATKSTPSVNEDDMEAAPNSDMDGGANTISCAMKRPWLTRLMLGLSGCEKPWLVPWTSFTIFQVMFLWFCTFWLVGSWIIPFAAYYAGCSKDTLTYRGQALYSLITDIAEGTVGLGILHRCLARFKPLPRNWFPFSWQGQWYVDVLLGCLTFPVVNRLSQLNLELLPFPSPFTSYEQSIMARDPIASVLYAIVVSVCCPIWEEVIFRGFLLPSLTRYLPVWASIFVSAVIFGLAHFNVQRILPLTFLGLVMGIMFVRSRNLLSSMLLHSLWNGFVFIGLLR